jgi:hypothetical protein
MKRRVSGMLAGQGIASDSFVAVCWECKQLPKSPGLQALPDVPKEFLMDVDTDFPWAFDFMAPIHPRISRGSSTPPATPYLQETHC